MGKIYIFIHALCVDNIGQFMTGSFIVLVPKWRKQNQPRSQPESGAPGRYVKLVSCPISLFDFLNLRNNFVSVNLGLCFFWCSVARTSQLPLVMSVYEWVSYVLNLNIYLHMLL